MDKNYWKKYKWHRGYNTRKTKTPVTDKEATAREIDILKARESGERMVVIGKRYGITRQRVQQILKKVESKLAI